MISGIFTVIAFLSFAGIAVWAYSRRNRERFDEASRLPLRDEAPTGHCGSGCGCGKPGA
jgi:cytochrome c oxidase cbb3-type subunit 4